MFKWLQRRREAKRDKALVEWNALVKECADQRNEMMESQKVKDVISQMEQYDPSKNDELLQYAACFQKVQAIKMEMSHKQSAKLLSGALEIEHCKLIWDEVKQHIRKVDYEGEQAFLFAKEIGKQVHLVDEKRKSQTIIKYDKNHFGTIPTRIDPSKVTEDEMYGFCFQDELEQHFETDPSKQLQKMIAVYEQLENNKCTTA